MRNFALTLLIILAAGTVTGQTWLQMTELKTLPPLPEPVTNNAVASVKVQDREFIISFAGLALGKSHNDTHARTFVLDDMDREWLETAAIPGDVGRLAATAIGVGERAYVFGGYTVAEDGSEVSTPWVHAFDPLSGEFEERQSMPVPVDDAIAVSYENRFIYLISSWHDFGNDNPHNFDGIGYAGKASSPSADALFFSLESYSWQQIAVDGPATMDHRGLVPFDGDWLTIGGMLEGQQVSDNVASYEFD